MDIRASIVIVTVCLFSLVSLAMSYMTAVSLGHVRPFIPYIGDTGDLPPESMVFTQLFAITSTLLMVVVQVRFVQVSRYFDAHHVADCFSYVNDGSVVAGYVSTFGLLVSSCFQESHARLVHNLAGSGLFLTGGSMYLTLQSAVSIRMMSLNGTAMVTYLRLVLTLAALSSLAVYALEYRAALKDFQKPWEERLHWGPEDGGWKSHVTSALAQWFLALFMNAYVSTFYDEFRHVYLNRNRIAVSLPELGREVEEST